ncbi:MAG: adenylosuccinate lyase, partial [Acidimicrobiales bacterium]
MIERYSLPDMAELFSDESRLRLWLEIELLAVESWSRLGVVPKEHAAACRASAPAIDASFLEKVGARERVVDHDVAAFVDVVQEAIGPPAGSWIHHGLTSADVVDTALSVTLSRAANLLIDASSALVAALRRRALEHANTAMVGRTHGMHAEPTTFGAKLALFCLQAMRDTTRLETARDAISVGKVSGAVGTYSNIDPQVEADVCAALGLRPVPASQVIARDRHAEYLYGCAAATTTVEALAMEVRHLQRSEVGEVAEPFSQTQKGSSAMPHKHNPVVAERLCGLARVLRGNLVAGFEDVALWHERDISHSSVERIILPDSSLLTYYCLRRAAWLVRGMSVDVDRMHENLVEGSHGLVFSQPALLALVGAGVSRDDAYRIVQRDAGIAEKERTPLRGILERDPDLEAALGGSEARSGVLDEVFDLDHALAKANRVLDAIRPDRSGPGASRADASRADA